MDKTIVIHIRVNREEWEEFKEMAKSEGSHGAVEVRKLIKKFIKDNRKNEK